MRLSIAIVLLIASTPAHATIVACLSQLELQACCDDAEFAAYQNDVNAGGTRGECAVHTHNQALAGWTVTCQSDGPVGCSDTATALSQAGDPTAQANFATMCNDNGWAPSTARRLYTCCDNAMDSDGDGLMDCDEQTLGTDPLLADSDGDTLSDGDEVNLYPTDPKNTDTDNDGLDDGYEVYTAYTDPVVADSDNDGLLDGAELSTDSMNPDTDGDTLLDGAEVNAGTDPTDPCDPNACDSADTAVPVDTEPPMGDSGDSGTGDSGGMWEGPVDSGAPTSDSGM
ncbi:MAG: hypothetical protein ACI9K2_004051 [Myxococcota bacterium]|jgi:hypothetical protein